MLPKIKPSETITENIFRDFYGAKVFIEKSAISDSYGFKAKSGSKYKGFPDFFRDEDEFVIVAEAKSTAHSSAISEVKHYGSKNNIHKDILCIAISGQNESSLRVTYFLRLFGSEEFIELQPKDSLLSLADIKEVVRSSKYSELITADSLVRTLNNLNKTFQDSGKVRDTKRGLFFSGLMIALRDNNFRNTYKNIQAPTERETKNKGVGVLESHNLNDAILRAITNQIDEKANNSLSKQYHWVDEFSFYKNIDYSLNDYIEIISLIEDRIFAPFQNDEKQDILGRAYKIFLSRAGKVDNKNIIITPDHIKSLMIKLARLDVDDIVLDTCTGTGGFLMEAMETLIKKANGNPKKIREIKEEQLIGFENDSVLFALACSNMFLHGDGRTNMIFRSSLLDGQSDNIVNSSDEDILKFIREKKPTKIIINPPYENNKSIKFVKQALDYLERNGKLIIIMPTPTLKMNQGKNGKEGLTEQILKNARLDFVIKMPTVLFSEQGRTVNTSIFGFTKAEHEKDDEIHFYNLEDDGFVSVQHKGRIDKHKRWDSIEKTVLKAIKSSEINPGFSEKRELYKDNALNCYGFRKSKSEDNSMVKVSELFSFAKGTISSEDGDGGNEVDSYDFITASEEWKKHSTYALDKEAIIFAFGASGSLGRTHYVNGKFSASNLCYVLTPKKDSSYMVNLEFYNWYFAAIRKQLISDLADGTSKLTIRKTDLEEYYIDYIDYSRQVDFVKNNVIHYINVKHQYLETTEKTKQSMQAILLKDD
ncbi:MAG: N-6 DNA methylase [Oscillospiraceae bacterium]|nr:N-6 DNA methylase [Oscillospiraceae bacterium]